MARLENPRMKTGGDAALGAKIRRYRNDADVTLEEMAQFLGISYQAVGRYENGLNRISAVRLFDIAAYLGVPVEDFFQPITRVEHDIFASERSVALVRRYNSLSEESQNLAYAILVGMSSAARVKRKKAKAPRLELVA